MRTSTPSITPTNPQFYLLLADAIGTDGRLRGNGASWRSDPHIVEHTAR